MNALTHPQQIEEKNQTSNLLSWIINETTILVLNNIIDSIYKRKISWSKYNSYYPDFIVETWIEVLKNTNTNLKQTFKDIFVKNKYVWKIQILELIDFFEIDLIQNWWFRDLNFELQDIFNIVKELKKYNKVLEIYSQNYVKVIFENENVINVEYIDLEWNLKNVNIKK